MTIQTVRTDSFSMDYFRFGRGNETLVILPGLSVQSVMGLAVSVAKAYGALEDDFTVYVLDRRKELPDAYSVHDMARDTAEAIKALGLDRVSIFGASQGGMMGMSIAIEHPELVQKLILGSTSARVDQAQYQVIERWIELAESGNAADLYLAFGEAIYPPDVFEQYREALIVAAKSVTAEDLKRFVILAKGIEGFDVLDDLEKIACPTLVIGSRDDRVLGAEASETIADRLNARSELYMYDGRGHAAFDTAPDYKERMLRFLKSGIKA